MGRQGAFLLSFVGWQADLQAIPKYGGGKDAGKLAWQPLAYPAAGTTKPQNNQERTTPTATDDNAGQ